MKRFSFWLMVMCMAASGSLFAQKLPNKQTVGLRAPANIKIDGMANEWGDQFQAYNTATDLYYTIANDDAKLYLTVQATNWNTINNILNGGVKFVIQKNGRKDDADAPFIKYPYLEKGNPIMINPNVAQGDTNAVTLQDNKLLATKIKWIYVKGLGGMDTVLSIYNDRGISAANALDVKRRFTLETSIELSLLGLSAKDRSKISYHILVNAEPNKFTYAGLIDPLRSVLVRNMTNFNSNMEQVDKAVGSFESAGNKFSATTDFSGEYTLAK